MHGDHLDRSEEQARMTRLTEARALVMCPAPSGANLEIARSSRFANKVPRPQAIGGSHRGQPTYPSQNAP